MKAMQTDNLWELNKFLQILYTFYILQNLVSEEEDLQTGTNFGSQINRRCRDICVRLWKQDGAQFRIHFLEQS